MANEKAKPTEREVRLAKVISGLSLGVDALLRQREKITEVLSEICEHIDESTESAMVEMEGLNRDLRESMPELFSGAEEPAAEDSEDSEEPKPPLTKGQWVKVKKPGKNESKNINWHHCMDRFDGKIMQISFVFSMVGSRSDTLQWYVKLEGAEGDRSLGEPYVRWSFDPAWLTPLPDLPEGWRYLQPEELVAAGDECCALEYSRCADWWASGNVGRKQAAGGMYRRRTATEAPAEGKTEGETEGEAVVTEAPEPSAQAEQITSSIFPDAPTRAWRDAVAKIISAPPSDGHLRTANGDRMFKIISWIVREVDFTRNLVWIDAHLRVLVPTHKDEHDDDVYESLIFDKNLFAPQTDSPIIEYPERGDLLSKDGLVYLANDWRPSLICDRPVEVTTTLGVEFYQFDLPDAPSVVAAEPPAEPEAEAPAEVAEVAEAPKPAWEPKEGDWVTITKPADGDDIGWISFTMDKYDGEEFQISGELVLGTKGSRWAEGPGGYYFNLAWLSPAPAKVAVPEAKVEADDADKWRVPDVNDIGKVVEVRDFEHDYWETCRLVAILSYDLGHGTFVCRKATPSELTYSWKHARILKEPQPEAPQKPVKAPVTAYHIDKQILVTQRLKGFESSFVRILKGITIRKDHPHIIEYAVGRSPTDCFHDILYINPDDPDSEYQIEPLDD